MKISTSFWRKIMSRTRFIVVLGLVLFVVGLSIAIAGPFGFFGRGAGNCANGSCSVQEPEPEPLPVVVDNSILDNKPVLSTTSPPANDILGVDNDILAGCDCKSCKCKECSCDHCKCEDCPGKQKLVVKELPPIQAIQQTEYEEPVQQYEYTERPRLLRRIFGRR